MNFIQLLFSFLNQLCTADYALIGSRIAYQQATSTTKSTASFFVIPLLFLPLGSLLACSFGGVSRDVLMLFRRPALFDIWQTVLAYVIFSSFVLGILHRYKKMDILDSWPCYILVNFLDGMGLALFVASAEDLVVELGYYTPAFVVACACVSANGGGIWAKILTGKQTFKMVVFENLWYYGITIVTAIQYYFFHFEMMCDGASVSLVLGTVSGSLVCLFVGCHKMHVGGRTHKLKKDIAVRIGLIQTLAAIFRSILNPYKGIKYSFIVFGNVVGPYDKSLITLLGII